MSRKTLPRGRHAERPRYITRFEQPARIRGDGKWRGATKGWKVDTKDGGPTRLFSDGRWGGWMPAARAAVMERRERIGR